jgi:glycosyltransferase involved in cell wall biosynthesis
MPTDLISIITPSFNRGNIIHETAESIFKQTYPNWEWVIVDDGSTDNSWEVLQQLAAKDNRVKIFQRDREPKGACTSRNIAVEKSSGTYVLFLDTDDLLASFCLEQRINAAQKHPECDFIIFPMLLFKHKPNDLGLLWNIDNETNDIDRIFFGDAICQGTGTLWKKESFRKIGMWDEKLLLWQDVELHLRAFIGELKYAKCFNLEPDIFIRISDESLSRTGFFSLPKLNSRLLVFKNTTEALFSKKLIGKHQKGIRHMFIDLFVNANQGKHFGLVSELYRLSNKYNLFSKREEGKLKRFEIMNKFRLYKVPRIQPYLRNEVVKLEQPGETTLGKQLYKREIKL